MVTSAVYQVHSVHGAHVPAEGPARIGGSGKDGGSDTPGAPVGQVLAGSHIPSGRHAFPSAHVQVPSVSASGRHAMPVNFIQDSSDGHSATAVQSSGRTGAGKHARKASSDLVLSGSSFTQGHRSGDLERLRTIGPETGMATAEYAIATLAAVGFAGVLVFLLRSDEVRGFLLNIIRSALSLP